MTGMEIFQWACLVIGSGLLLAGSAFSIIGGIGVCRLPDFYSRMHGAGITDTMGAGLVLIGLVLYSGVFSLVAYKLLAILFFFVIASPSSCHALAHSALVAGLKPELDFEMEGHQVSSGEEASPAKASDA